MHLYYKLHAELPFLTCSLLVLLAALTRGCRGFNELSYLFSNTTTTLMASTCSFTELWPLAKWLSVWRGNRIRLRVSTNKIRVPNLICNYTLHNYPNGKISTASNSCRSSKLDIWRCSAFSSHPPCLQIRKIHLYGLPQMDNDLETFKQT